MWGDQKGGGPTIQKVGAPKVWGPKGGSPEGWRAKISRFFPSRASFSLIVFSLKRSSRRIVATGRGFSSSTTRPPREKKTSENGVGDGEKGELLGSPGGGRVRVTRGSRGRGLGDGFGGGERSDLEESVLG